MSKGKHDSRWSGSSQLTRYPAQLMKENGEDPEVLKRAERARAPGWRGDARVSPHQLVPTELFAARVRSIRAGLKHPHAH